MLRRMVWHRLLLYNVLSDRFRILESVTQSIGFYGEAKQTLRGKNGEHVNMNLGELEIGCSARIVTVGGEGALWQL